MKPLLLFPVLWGFCTLSFAQQYVITGSILDGETTEALMGATLLNPATNEGTLAGVDGQFELKLSAPEGILRCSYIGFAALEIPYHFDQPGRQRLEISLKEVEITTCSIFVTADRSEMKEIIVCRWPGPCAISRLAISAGQGNRWFSSPQVVQSRSETPLHIRNSSLNSSPLQLQFPGRPANMGPQLRLNGMQMDSRLAQTYRFLWEDRTGYVEYEQSPQSLAAGGPMSLGGSVNFTDNQVAHLPQGLRYQAATGMSLPYGTASPAAPAATQRGFLEQHQLSYVPAKLKIPTEIRLGFGSRQGLVPGDRWESLRGSLRSAYQTRKFSWKGDFRTARLLSQAPGLESHAEQFTVMQHRATWLLTPQTQLSLGTLSLRHRNRDYTLQQQLGQVKLHHQSARIEGLNLEGGYEFLHWQDRQNHAVRVGGTYDLGPHWQVESQFRQDLQQQQGRLTQARTMTAGLSVRGLDIGCAPSRTSLSLQSGLMQVKGQTAWLNQLRGNLALEHNLEVISVLEFNHFNQSTAIDLGWVNWSGQGKQNQLGARLSLRSNQQLGHHVNWQATGYLSYNQPYYAEGPTMLAINSPVSSRMASPGRIQSLGQRETLPRGMYGMTHSVGIGQGGIDCNLWGWWGAPQAGAAGNGFRLQELRGWFTMVPEQQGLPVRQMTVYVQGENLLSANADGNSNFDAIDGYFSSVPQTRNLILGLDLNLF